MYTGGIDEYNLPARFGENAQDTMAGGLWLGGDDGQLLADDPVEQRRLADVGSAEDGNSAGDSAGRTILTVGAGP